MRTFAQKPKATQQTTPAKSAILSRAQFGRSRDPNSILNLQRTIGNQAVQRLLQVNAEELNAGSATTASPRFMHDFSRIPIYPSVAGAIQTKLAINKPGDEYEQEADRVSEQVMRMSESQLQRACACGGGYPKCQMEQPGQEHEPLHTKHVGSSDLEQTAVPPIVHEVLATPSQPLDPSTRGFMEPRFGHAFSKLRVHTDAKAAESAHAIGAAAYVMGHDIVFGAGRFAPETQEGRQLIAHELTHVVQQSGADGVHADQKIQRQPEGSEGTGAGPGPVVKGTGDVSIYVGKTMTSEAALRQIYRESARKISEEALRMVAQVTSVEDAARWAHQARNDLKVMIRLRGSPIIRGLAEARNIRKYGDKIGPTYEELIRQGKTPEDIIGSAGKASTKVNRVAAKLRVGGRFFIGLDIATVTWEVFSAPEGERLRTAVAGGARVAGTVGGGWAGAKGGAAAGFAIAGPIGAAVVGVLGGIGGALFGGWLGGKAAEKAYDLVEDLVNPPSGSIWDLQVIVIDGIEDEYIRTQARRHP